MIAVELSRIVIDEEKREQVVVLKETDGNRMLPIVIGLNEAAAIRMQFTDFVPPRPMTHDLICTIIDSLQADLEKVVIDKLEESTFHAKLYLTSSTREAVVDARPSDSIAIAVRTRSPIFVEEEVFEKVSPGI
ncbi:MAG: bifunctional nuclease family protein [Candidatus Omnitrophica bacterium]|nr:bifunctional nuclease family protein [Candidatus Omnitrophota bacterium]